MKDNLIIISMAIDIIIIIIYCPIQQLIEAVVNLTNNDHMISILPGPRRCVIRPLNGPTSDSGY